MNLDERLEIWRESARSHGRELIGIPEETSLQEYQDHIKEIFENPRHEGSPQMFGRRTLEFSETWRRAIENELQKYDIPEEGVDGLAKFIGFELREEMRKEGVMQCLQPKDRENEKDLAPDTLGYNDWMYDYVNGFVVQDRIAGELPDNVEEIEAGWEEAESFTSDHIMVYEDDWVAYRSGGTPPSLDEDAEYYLRELGVGSL